ncbi:hypothetical protein [Staphylococcus lugdunensis]|uniref:hypothetical protein n=1 Tax=Staphylococcus lugdunensis TaxID=28035 RepID=UPI0022654B0E|nr:hypothetical protein [Staphylococcus lugdunensis]UZW89834.1 hypothetical protein LE165_09565 [Staphylococcus lugdunensis]
MVKIKTKKEMNLHELIKCGWENNVRDKVFSSDCGGHVYFRLSALLEAADVGAYETFAVEVEEEITEETKINRLLVLKNAMPENYEELNVFKTNTYGNYSISEVKNEQSKAMYIINDDMTMTLIWKDGELVNG